ncbi:salicylate hydroxylase [Hypoxylon sp. FL1150]|nr:salicylate hydroxylase [Hypoxylon sp. FL1150]
MQSQLRVAIVGGGPAGATLANALVRLSHVDVHVFESAPEFSGRDAAVGLAKKSQSALAQVLPPGAKLLEKAGAVPMNSSRIILKLTVINTSEPGVEVAFQDGSTYHFDAVIGADGIFSTVRDHVLQGLGIDKQNSPSPAGFWDCRNVVPLEKAKATLGEKYFDVDRQYGWVGNDAFVRHDILEDKTMDASKSRNRERPLIRETLKISLKNWLRGPIADGMNDLIYDQPDPCGYSQWEHKSTPTFVGERVCVVGDAAHATTPRQGSSAALAIEDAMVLGTLFANISSPTEIGAAFKAYVLTRRSRCQQVIDSGRDTGQILCGQMDLHADELRKLLAPRWNFIICLNVELHKHEALEAWKKMQ